MSDGDNICWLEGGWTGPRWYGSRERGSVPMGWTFSPATSELMPTVLKYARDAATSNDSLLAGPSGAGYAYPDQLSPGRRTTFAKATAQMMAASGMRLLNVIGGVPSGESLDALAAQDDIDAIFYYTYGAGYSGLRGNVAYVNGKPVIGGRRSLWGDGTKGTMLGPKALIDVLMSLPTDVTDPNAYSIVPVSAWGYNYSQAAAVIDTLQASGRVEVVLPGELVKRLVERTGRKEQCPMARGNWSLSCLECELSGDGTCLLGCANCKGKNAKCDLSVCADLSLTDDGSRFVCNKSGKLCPERSMRSMMASPSSRVRVPTVARAGRSVPPNFVGLSIEVTAVLAMLGSTGNSTPMAQCLRNLASLTPQPHAGPVLRLGGNSADKSCFDDSSTPGCAHRITKEELAAYKEFAHGVGADLNVSYVIDTNFGVSADPHAVATKHVAALGDAGLWPLVRAVEVGNEVDIYAKSTPSQQKAKGHRNMSYEYDYYEPEFGEYIKAYRAAGMPPRMVQGATYCSLSPTDRGGFDSNISRYLSVAREELRSFSYHRYPTSHCSGHNTSIAALLSDHSTYGQLLRLGPIIDQVTIGAGIEFWIGEGNSASCGGMPNVSDTFASALWAADFLALLSLKAQRERLQLPRRTGRHLPADCV